MIKTMRTLFMALSVILAAHISLAATVLFDQGHKQVFLVEKTGVLDLSRFADILQEGGLTVRSTTDPLTPETLEEVDALIISGAFAPFSPSEKEAVRDFVKNGGKLAIMLHIPFPLEGLLDEFGILYSNGVIREQNNIIDQQNIDFSAATDGQHPLVDGVERIGLYGAWAVMGRTADIEEVAATTAHAWVDLNKDGVLSKGDAMQKLAVMVAGTLGEGEFVIFGDDAIFQNRFIHNQNEKLAQNFARWIDGKHQR